MNYESIYHSICSNRQANKPPGGVYCERHHIIPRCAGGNDEASNLVVLTGREHFVCHWLLTKIYKGTAFERKMIYAFNLMCADNVGRGRYSKHYHRARALFKHNHPTKDPNVRVRISRSLREYNQSLTPEERRRTSTTRLCKCGCGESFVVFPSSKRLYVDRSHVPFIPNSEETKRKKSNTVKMSLAQLTPEERLDRMNNSVQRGDQELRAQKISAAKRGKKTRQPMLEEIKYGTMTEVEFANFVAKSSHYVWKRLNNRRNAYLENVKRNQKHYEQL